jgi:hypothetical protein
MDMGVDEADAYTNARRPYPDVCRRGYLRSRMEQRRLQSMGVAWNRHCSLSPNDRGERKDTRISLAGVNEVGSGQALVDGGGLAPAAAHRTNVVRCSGDTAVSVGRRGGRAGEISSPKIRALHILNVLTRQHDATKVLIRVRSEFAGP